MPFIVTANRLTDGVVVYRHADQWSPSIDAADRYETRGLAEPAAQADGRHAVDIAVIEIDDGLRPRTLRDSIRAYGPTVDYARAGAPPSALPLPAQAVKDDHVSI